MRTSFKPLQTLVLAAALSTLAGYSMAQPALGGGPNIAAGHGQNMWQRDPAKMQARMTKRLAALKLKLHITPAQEAAWTTYTDALKPKPRAPIAGAPADLSHMTTPERLDRMHTLHAERMAEMTAQLDQRAQATKTFYAVLSADQQKVFDEEFNRALRGHGARPIGPMGGQRQPG